LGGNINPQAKIEFLIYTAKHGKSYPSTEEFLMRFANWQDIDS